MGIVDRKGGLRQIGQIVFWCEIEIGNVLDRLDQSDLTRRYLAHRPNDFGVSGMPDKQDVLALFDLPLRLPVNLADEGTGRIDIQHVAAFGFGRHRLGDAVSTEDHRRIVGNLVQLLDKYGPLGFETVDHVLIVHDFVTHIDGRAELEQRPLDYLDRTIDAGTESAGRCDNELQRQTRIASGYGRRGWKGGVHVPPSSAFVQAKLGQAQSRGATNSNDRKRETSRMTIRTRLLPALALGLALAGCAKEGDLVIDQGVGITAVRSTCPAVGIPDYTGDITTFRTPGSTTSADLDVTAAITNLRSTCNESADDRVYTEATFDVVARRADTSGSRTVTLPYFSTVLRGGSSVVTKRIGSVTLQFADGQERAQARGTAGAYVNRAEATLPAEIRDQITRKREAGDPDAALDPLADPTVRAALQRATFELLVGFQLTEDQLRYNATR